MAHAHHHLGADADSLFRARVDNNDVAVEKHVQVNLEALHATRAVYRDSIWIQQLWHGVRNQLAETIFFFVRPVVRL